MTDFNGWTNRETWIIESICLATTSKTWQTMADHLMADYIEETVWDMLRRGRHSCNVLQT
jgi:hypothetical protein